ncbi:hypothetical protein BDW59DRAFT_177561 [Aspergillus cavernicola]|uniref:Aminoglycoside phosphotransferase domain-containing protein n=1 Tax=Aspergillus cavernicola TaxID=176166 RepID=A0ABR4ISM4_9EURO
MGHAPESVFNDFDQLKASLDLTPRRKSGRKILQISESTILKVCWRVNIYEAETLIFLATKTKVPVPEVLSEMLVSYIETMSAEELHVISCQLKSYVMEWRTLGSSFLGAVDGGPCEDIIFKHPWNYTSTKQYGPFDSLELYKLGVIEALRLSRPDGIWYEKEEALKEKVLFLDGMVSGIVDWGEAGSSFQRGNSSQLSVLPWMKAGLKCSTISFPFTPKNTSLWDEVDRSMMRYSPVEY